MSVFAWILTAAIVLVFVAGTLHGFERRIR